MKKARRKKELKLGRTVGNVCQLPRFPLLVPGLNTLVAMSEKQFDVGQMLVQQPIISSECTVYIGGCVNCVAMEFRK